MTTHVLVPRRSARLARPLGAGLFGDFDRLFDEFWGSPGSAVSRAVTPAALAPRMDYSETDDAIRLRAEMPGLDEKDIDVSLEEGVLTIKGEHAEERDEKDEEKGFQHVETYRGSFHRALRLPVEVDEDAVEAAYKNGILTVTLPKRPEAKPEVRSIPVSTS
jgi:HSP20 family protein